MPTPEQEAIEAYKQSQIKWIEVNQHIDELRSRYGTKATDLIAKREEVNQWQGCHIAHVDPAFCDNDVTLKQAAFDLMQAKNDQWEKWGDIPQGYRVGLIPPSSPI